MVVSLRARCANCGVEESLARIADGDGSCAVCHSRFCSDENTLLFLRDVFRVDVAYRLLLRGLSDLSSPRVQLRVLPEPLFLGLAAGVAWPEGIELPAAVRSYVSLFPTRSDELHIDARIDRGEAVPVTANAAAAVGSPGGREEGSWT